MSTLGKRQIRTPRRFLTEPEPGDQSTKGRCDPPTMKITPSQLKSIPILAGPASRIVIRKTRNQFMQDILASFGREDVVIQCPITDDEVRKAALVKTSSLLLSVASPFLRHLLGSVEVTSNDNLGIGCSDTPAFAIILPDVDPEYVVGLLEYISKGTYLCNTVKESQAVQELINLFGVGVGYKPPVRPQLLKGSVDKKMGWFQGSNWHALSGSILDPTPTPAPKKQKVEEAINNFDDDEGLCNLDFVPTAADYQWPVKTEPSSQQITPVKTKRQRTSPKTVGQLGKNQIDMKVPCPYAGCGFTGRTLASSISHVDDVLQFGWELGSDEADRYVVRQPSTTRSTGDSKVHCSICRAEMVSFDFMTAHVQEHMVEAHESKKHCMACYEEYGSVAQYFRHLETTKHQKAVRKTLRKTAKIGGGGGEIVEATIDEKTGEIKPFVSEDAMAAQALQQTTNPGDPGVQIEEAVAGGAGDIACPICNIGFETLEHCTGHIEDLLASEGYQMGPLIRKSAPGGNTTSPTLVCPVCNFQSKSEKFMQAHLKAHMEEAHRKAKICLTCDPPSFLDTTALYFDHLAQHNSASAKLKRVAASDAVDMHEGMEDSILNAAAVVLNPDVEAILYQPTRMDASATNTERNLELGCPVCGHDGGTLSSSLAHIQSFFRHSDYSVSIDIQQRKPKKDFKGWSCPICMRCSKNDVFLRNHLRTHMEEAHNVAKTCRTCKVEGKSPCDFSATWELFEHYGDHDSTKEKDPDAQNPACPVCGEDGGSLESSVGHLESLMADQETDGGPWRVPEFKVLKDGQMRCQLCFSHLKNEDRMRIHLKAHMRDAHLRISQCVKCDPPASFASTAEYMEHSKSHSSFVMKKRKRPEEKVRLGQENVRKAPIYTMYKPPSAGEPGHNDPKCPQCSFDGETLESSMAHIETVMQVAQDPYKLPEMKVFNKGREGTVLACPICCTHTKENHRLRLHLKFHMREAHLQEKACQLCQTTFDSTSEYFSHLQEHYQKNNERTKKWRENTKGGTLSAKAAGVKDSVFQQELCCPVCKFDGGTTASSVAHIDHLVNKGSSTPAFLLKEQTVRESGEALCTVCKKLLKSETHLRVHLKIHMREAHQETKECAKCDAVFESTVEYFKHVRSHNEGNRYGRNPQDRPCPYCGKVLKPPSFANHKRECQRRQESNYILCGLCEYKAVSKPALSQHVSRMHGGPKNFICKEQVSRSEGVGVCGQGFLRQCDMDKHIRSKHLSNPVQCDVCGSTQRNEYALYNHKRVRHNAAIKEHNNALKRIRKERMRIKNETVPQHQGVKTITPFGMSQ